jgi:hypothetical protein
MNLRVPYKAGNFRTTSATNSFSTKILSTTELITVTNEMSEYQLLASKDNIWPLGAFSCIDVHTVGWKKFIFSGRVVMKSNLGRDIIASNYWNSQEGFLYSYCYVLLPYPDWRNQVWKSCSRNPLFLFLSCKRGKFIWFQTSRWWPSSWIIITTVSSNPGTKSSTEYLS